LRTSTKTYPTAAYLTPNGTTSTAETIQYFLRADTAGGRSNVYVLYRRVNDRDSTLVTRNLYVPADSNFFFQYSVTTASGATASVAQASLPLYWDDAQGRTDSITAVQLRATGVYWDTRTRVNVYRQLFTIVKLRNALRFLQPRCGAVPDRPDSLGVTEETAPAGDKLGVRLEWSAVPGDSTAPRDVRQYVLYRRLSGVSTWTPIGSKPALGANNYRYADYALPTVAGTYRYGLAARNCSGVGAVRSGTETVTFP
jgi:hypothetical protein